MSELRKHLEESYDKTVAPLIDAIEYRRGGGRGSRMEIDYYTPGFPNIPLFPFENRRGGGRGGMRNEHDGQDIEDRGRRTSMEYRPIGYNAYDHHRHGDGEEVIEMEKVDEMKKMSMDDLEKQVITNMLHMNEKKLEHGLKHMEMPNGEKKYSIEESENIRKDYKLNFDGKFKDVNRYDFNYAINMMKSDYHDNKKTDYDYAKAAHQMLTDDDFPIPGTNANAWYETKIKYKRLSRELGENK